MASEGGSEGPFDDLFDDMDRFFEDEGKGEPAPGAPSHAGEGSSAEAAAAAAEGAGPDDAEDILPPDWQDVADLDFAASAGERPEIETEAGTTGTSGTPHPTAEMSGQDWQRLRDVLGEGEEPEEFLFPAEEPAVESDANLFGYEEADEEEGEMLLAGATPPPSEPSRALPDPWGEREPEPPRRRIPDLWAPQGQGPSQPGEPGPDEPPAELSIEDLKKAPAEYRDLPGPSDEEPAGEAPPSLEEPEPNPFVETPAAPAGGGEGDYWSEPGIAEVEAAADRLAREFERAGTESEEAPVDDLLATPAPPARRTIKVGTDESMSGPTWEEPSSRPVRAEPRGRGPLGGDRDLPAAVITGVGLGVLALISIFISKWLFATVAGAIVLLGQAELYNTMHRRGYQPATALGLVGGALVMGAAYLKGEAAVLAMIPLCLILTFLWYMVAGPKAREGSVANIACTMFGVLYAPLLAGYVLIILSLSSSGRALALSVLALAFLYDVAAFGIGSFWGTRALAPSISPKKTWEGLVGATILVLVVSVAFLAHVGPLTPWRAVGLWLVVVVFAPLGDLAESAIKRDLGVKDMGSILPGHGGILDRIDSVLFVAPAAFYFFRLIF